MVSGDFAERIPARISTHHAQFEHLGIGFERNWRGNSAKRTTGSGFIDERDGSGSGAANFSRREEIGFYVRPFGDDGDLDERPRRQQRRAVDGGGWSWNAEVVAGQRMDCL